MYTTSSTDLLLQAVLLAGLGVLEADITTSGVTQVHMSIQLVSPVIPQTSQCLSYAYCRLSTACIMCLNTLGT